MTEMTSNSNLSNPKVIAAQVAQEIPSLRLLVLFGSRAKQKATEKSDWDLAILTHESSTNSWEELALYEKLGHILQVSSDRVDLVNLNHCSPLLGYIVAREGKLLYETEPELFLKFQLKAWKIYADTAKFRYAQEDYIHRSLERLKQ